MRLGEILRPAQVVCGLSASGKEEAITILVDRLVATGALPATLRATALKAVLDREKSLSTGMEHGIAIPHGSIDEMDDMACALGISSEGVEFGTLDGKPAHLVILIVIARKRFSRHVRTLAGIARLLNNAVMRDRLKRAGSPEEAVRIVNEEEGAEAGGRTT